VAGSLFHAARVRATGTEKIMSIAKLAKATFSRHFQSKSALVLAYSLKSFQSARSQRRR
jgi:AcrR family transcriptional regulator